MHTKDAHLNLGNPGIVRDVVGEALDKVRGLQEEIDYTLDVYRTEGSKDVSTETISNMQTEIARLTEENARAKEAWEMMRDSILNERDSLAESGLTSDQVNDVLGVVDDHYPFVLAARSNPQEAK
jgi:hypothetical protein